MCIRDRAKALHPAEAGESAPTTAPSQLRQWPVQIKLVPVNAPYFDGARLLIAADCTAYAYAAFHERFIRGHITLVGCPKLDDVDYSEKLTAIIRSNDIQEVTVVRMEVPCCGGLENAAKRALQADVYKRQPQTSRCSMCTRPASTTPSAGALCPASSRISPLANALRRIRSAATAASASSAVSPRNSGTSDNSIIMHLTCCCYNRTLAAIVVK